MEVIAIRFNYLGSTILGAKGYWETREEAEEWARQQKEPEGVIWVVLEVQTVNWPEQ